MAFFLLISLISIAVVFGMINGLTNGGGLVASVVTTRVSLDLR